MKSRETVTLTKSTVQHTVTKPIDLTVVHRPCDFCDARTPVPTKEQLDGALLVAAASGASKLVPSLTGTGEIRYHGEYCFHPEGWELLGPGPALPASRKRRSSYREH